MRTSAILAASAVWAATLAAPFGDADATSVFTTADDITTTTPIKHLVVVFQENASFDHYFGTYPIALNPDGEPAFVPRLHTPEANNLLPTSLNGNRDLRTTNPNQAKPFRLKRSEFVTCSQDHGYKAEQRAANGGLMNRFVQATNKESAACLADLPRPVPSPQVMGYFDGNTVTALWNYAQHFALNDNSFATNYGPSTPGALNLVAGRTSGATGNDPDTVSEGVVYGDPDPAYDVCSDTSDIAELSGPNVGDLLTQAGVSWGWFQGGFRLDPADDPGVACTKGHVNRAGLEDQDYEAHHNPFQYFASTANPRHLPPSSVTAIGHDDQANHLYDLKDFWDAADAGEQPAVSFLKAPGYQDGHPGPRNSNPLDEQEFLVSTLNRLQGLPTWSSTAVVLAWDDSDGWYDHEPPPNLHHSHNPDKDGLYGTAANTLCMAPAGGQPPDSSSIFEMRCGFGERVPLLIVSPYAIENHVDHTPTDQTSVLRFIEDNWNLGRLGNASFDEGAGLLRTMFDFGQPREDTLMLHPTSGNPDQPPSITLESDSASLDYGDPLTPIGITTTDMDGDEVTVAAEGLPDGLVVTQTTTGSWEVTGTDQARAGVYDASLRASDGIVTTEAPLRITVLRENARVAYTGDLLFSTGSATTSAASVTLRAHVSQEADGTLGDVSRAAVLFDLYAPGSSTGTPDATYAASPDGDGNAVAHTGSLATGTWMLVVRTDPSGGFFEAPASDVVPITLYAPTMGSFVTAGGWVRDSGHAFFGLDARYRKDGTPSGAVAYVFSGADGQEFLVRSTGWQRGGLAISGTHATIAGTCEVTVLDSTGDVVSTSSDLTYRVDVTDVGKTDTFALTVFNPDGTTYHRAGTPTVPLPLGGGQVVVHH